MAPSQITEDYYNVLGIPQSAGSDAIRASYKKLALKYHPDRNPNNPQATAQFQLLEAAYSTLFDPERRRLYDIQYESIKRNSAKPDASQNPPPPQASNKKPDQSYKIQMEKLEATIQQLRNRKDELATQLAKARDECSTIQVTLVRLQAQADMDAEEEASRNSWYGYFFAKSQSAAEKLARQRRMVDNRAARTVREAELKRLKARLATTQSLFDDLERRIREKVNERFRLQDQEARRQEAAEWRRQQEMQREREERAREEAEKRQREEWAERVRKAQEAERVWKAEEAERRKAQEAERLRRAAEAKKHDEFLWQFWEDLPTEYSNTREAFQPAKQTKTGSERSQRGKRSRAGNTMGGQWGEAPDTRNYHCLHRSWWEREDGRHECERCLDTTRHCAFRCPSCRMVACADCRNILKRRR